ncbi:hypothetical protein RQP46_002812 [Phenoliferia psychrophenolica]
MGVLPLHVDPVTPVNTAGGGTPTTPTVAVAQPQAPNPTGNLAAGNGNGSPAAGTVVQPQAPANPTGNFGPATQAVVTAVFVNSLGSTSTGLTTLAPQLATAPFVVSIFSTNAQGQETIVVSTVSPAAPAATSNPSPFAAAPVPLASAVSGSPTVIEVTSLDASGNPTTFLSTIVPTTAPASVLTVTSTDAQGNPTTFLSTVPPSSPTDALSVLTITSTDSLGNPTTFLSTVAPPTVITIVETDSAGVATTFLSTLPPGASSSRSSVARPTLALPTLAPADSTRLTATAFAGFTSTSQTAVASQQVRGGGWGWVRLAGAVGVWLCVLA